MTRSRLIIFIYLDIESRNFAVGFGSRLHMNIENVETPLCDDLIMHTIFITPNMTFWHMSDPLSKLQSKWLLINVHRLLLQLIKPVP